MKVLSIRQPWAWLIVNGHKDIENRSWPTRFRGELLVHAGKGMTRDEHEDVELFLALRHLDINLPPYESLERGGIVGKTEIVDCVNQSESRWFMGEFGFVMRNARPLPFFPLRGQLGFFDAPANYRAIALPESEQEE